MKKLLIIMLVAMFVVSLVLTGVSCKEEAAPAVVEEAEEPAVEEATEEVEAAQPITIDYWENFIGDSKAQKWVIEQIMAKYPNLTLNSVNYITFDMEMKLQTALPAGTGPDIIYLGIQPSLLGRYVKAGLAYPLTEGVEKYGWDKKVFQWAQTLGTYEGELYAIGHEFEVLGLYYNKKIFEELDLKVPETLEDLEATMDKIKKNSDYIPMFYGCGEGAPNAIHMYNALAYAHVPIPEVMAATAEGDGSYLEPGWKEALQVLERWMRAGYFNDDALDWAWEGHWGAFARGEVAMLTQGSWLFKTLNDSAAENPEILELGWVAFPVPEGKPFQAYTGVGSGWWLTNNLEDDPVKREIVFEFLDLLISDEAITKWVTEDQIFPAVSIPSGVQLNEQQITAFEVAERAGSDGGGPLPLCWYNSAEETDAWVNGFQALLLGETDVDTIIKDVEVALKKSQEEWKE
ncbi:hypothetical protein ES707_20197 [subsurface metagenome]